MAVTIPTFKAEVRTSSPKIKCRSPAYYTDKLAGNKDSTDKSIFCYRSRFYTVVLLRKVQSKDRPRDKWGRLTPYSLDSPVRD